MHVCLFVLLFLCCHKLYGKLITVLLHLVKVKVMLENKTACFKMHLFGTFFNEIKAYKAYLFIGIISVRHL